VWSLSVCNSLYVSCSLRPYKAGVSGGTVVPDKIPAPTAALKPATTENVESAIHYISGVKVVLVVVAAVIQLLALLPLRCWW
jgi:hypothetical protein